MDGLCDSGKVVQSDGVRNRIVGVEGEAWYRGGVWEGFR